MHDPIQKTPDSLLRDDGDALRQAEVQAPQSLRVIPGEQLCHQVLVMVTVALKGRDG